MCFFADSGLVKTNIARTAQRPSVDAAASKQQQQQQIVEASPTRVQYVQCLLLLLQVIADVCCAAIVRASHSFTRVSHARFPAKAGLDGEGFNLVKLNN